MPDPTPAPKDFTEIGGSPAPGLTLRQVLRGHKGWIGRMAWSPDGKYLASPSSDKTIRIWDVAGGQCEIVLTGHEGGVYSVSWNSLGDKLVSGAVDGTLRQWDVKTGKLLQNVSVQEVGDEKEGVFSVAWAPKLSLIASGSQNVSPRLWHSSSLKLLTMLRGHHNFITCVAWSPEGSHLASAANDHAVCIWETETREELIRYIGHSHYVTQVAWAYDGCTIASSSNDATIHVWDVSGKNPPLILEGHSDRVTSISFSANNHFLASKSNDGSVRLWKMPDGKDAIFFSEMDSGEWASSLAFHPHLPILATLGEKDTIIRIWELDKALLLRQAKPSVHYTTAKLVLVGDSGVGKTGLGWRLAHGEYKEHSSTHGQQFWTVPQLNLKRKDGTECEAVLWDLAGQHVYRQIHAIFLENVAAALVLFDPSNRQDPLKGAQFWLEQLKGKGQLPPTVLVGARVDRGAPALSQQELDQFCQRHGITGGYLSTSALSGEGLDALLDKIKAQIPWDDMTATVTTVTFKRIKDHVLALKESTTSTSPPSGGRTGGGAILIKPSELRTQLEKTDADFKSASVSPNSQRVSSTSGATSEDKWEFTDAELLTAVGHLETHGYVAILRSSNGDQHLLLTPEILVNLAASVMLLADKNPRELGAVSETELLQGRYPFDELNGLTEAEQHILLDAAILRFLEHNICFRETLNDDTLLIFPSLIKQKRPLQDDAPSTDDLSYIVRGRVENLYSSLVVLLGYTPTFTRINQWQNQAQYEITTGQVCGFRMIEEREGELELVLYYADTMPADGRTKYQELFEQFLYLRDVEVTRIPPVLCPKRHRIERATVLKRAREGKTFVFCDECGERTALPDLAQPQTIGIGASAWLQREEAAARLRSAYEVALTRVKSYRRAWATPRCYLSHIPAQDTWADKLKHDLRDAGVFIVDQTEAVKPDDFVVVLETNAYRRTFETAALAADAQLIRARLNKRSLISLKLDGTTPGAHELKACTPGSFCDPTHYPLSLFDLVLNLYAIPFSHAGFAPEREKLHAQWEQAAERWERGDASGWTAHLDSRCAELFLQCAEFNSENQLRALFVNNELAPFAARLPTNPGSKTAYVAAVKEFLLNTRLADGRKLLLPFLAALREKYPAESALYQELGELYEATNRG